MKDSIRLVKLLEESALLIKDVNVIIKTDAKEQKSGFLRMLSGTLAASMLGNMLAEKPKIPGQRITRVNGRVTQADEDAIATSQGRQNRAG